MSYVSFRHFLAVTFFLLDFYLVFDYPFAKWPLFFMLMGFGIISVKIPYIWLLIIPAILPLLCLAPWSGRFFLEEFDFFILMAIAAAIWRGDYSRIDRPRLKLIPKVVIGFLLFTHCFALIRGVLPFETININSFNNYYSSFNALRVGKSFFWALVLIPPLLTNFDQYYVRSREAFLIGLCLGLIGTGLAVLWERGVFLDLIYGRNLWERLQSLTDFSSESRATGLLADMHTGGEAIDGYLALSWPFALQLLLSSKRDFKAFILGIISLPLGLYSALLTFSRGTFLAVGVSLLVLCLGYAKKITKAETNVWALILAFAIAITCIVFLFGKGGWYSIFAASLILNSSFFLFFIKNIRIEMKLIALATCIIAGGYLMLKGMLTSKWNINALDQALLITSLVSIVLTLSGTIIGFQLRNLINIKQFIVFLFIYSSLITVIVPIASGSYIQNRFNTVRGDFVVRVAHWKHALELMEPSWDSTVFGMGLGVFPRAYAWGNILSNVKENSSTAQLQKEINGNTYLQLSDTIDLTLGQRLSLIANQKYKLSLDVRSKSKNGRLGVSICRRNILHPILWNPSCIYYEQPVEQSTGEWQHLTWEFNIGDNGDGFKFGRKPLVLRLSNGLPQNQIKISISEDLSIDCDNVKLFDEWSQNSIKNGEFEENLDNWYIYTDFNHLPLHIKNIWVTVYFEQGIVGLLAFGCFVLYFLIIGMKLSNFGDNFSITILSSLIGFLTVGLIGTLLDVPRVSFLFFLMCFLLLCQNPTGITNIAKKKP